MRRTCLIVLALLAFATSATAQQSVVQKYRSNYPTPMSKEQLLALERSVATDVHGGLLRKPDGENCGGYSCDIVCFSDSELYDILGSSDTTASPQWNRTDNPRGYHCELVTPAPPIHPPTDDSDAHVLEQRLVQLEARVSALEKTLPPMSHDVTDLALSDIEELIRQQLETSKAILELLQKTATRFGLR